MKNSVTSQNCFEFEFPKEGCFPSLRLTTTSSTGRYVFTGRTQLSKSRKPVYEFGPKNDSLARFLQKMFVFTKHFVLLKTFTTFVTSIVHDLVI